MNPRRERAHFPTSDPSLVIVVTDDDSRTLRHLESGVTWHSESGALSESRLVFLKNSGIAERLEQKQPCRILEIGFGTGLNFWITASLALAHKTRLEFVSVEPRLLQAGVFNDLDHGTLPECQPALEQFLPSILKQFDSGTTKIQVAKNSIELTICRNEFDPTDFQNPIPFDTIYHDPFSPESAPELWSLPTFHALFQLLKPNGSIVTYCVKSEIQRRLKDAGFAVQKTRGPVGGKREVLIALRPELG